MIGWGRGTGVARKSGDSAGDYHFTGVSLCCDSAGDSERPLPVAHFLPSQPHQSQKLQPQSRLLQKKKKINHPCLSLEPQILSPVLLQKQMISRTFILKMYLLFMQKKGLALSGNIN